MSELCQKVLPHNISDACPCIISLLTARIPSYLHSPPQDQYRGCISIGYNDSPP